jgi:hypothetical protein
LFNGLQLRGVGVHDVPFRKRVWSDCLACFLDRMHGANCEGFGLRGKSLVTGVCFLAAEAESGASFSALLLKVGFLMHAYEAQLDALERELRQGIATPPADLPAFLDDWLRRLRAIPFVVSPKRRVTLLIDAAGQYYLHGQKVFNAVEPIALAAMLAEQEGEQTQLRRALSIQGLILTATRNTPTRCVVLRGRSISPKRKKIVAVLPRFGGTSPSRFSKPRSIRMPVSAMNAQMRWHEISAMRR